ncbi:hypothetical protein ON010_g1758 [Phytophthora cinnamomi]|nr:hypothetical protein ON010_g1758 [Phytophthora cinnamomi]
MRRPCWRSHNCSFDYQPVIPLAVKAACPRWRALLEWSPHRVACWGTASAWVPIGSLPKTEGYVHLDSAKYKEWQVLAYAAARDKTLLKWEAELYQQWLARQPPAVKRPSYPTPKGILQRSDEDSGEKPHVSSECDSADDSSVTDDSELMAEEHHRRLDATTGDSTG